ncbi:hypothetical protein HK405_014099 [Cladochytrium tenue]|nr:hypothetical protein HK405_014099 [Cladochytrium tenue]
MRILEELALDLVASTGLADSAPVSGEDAIDKLCRALLDLLVQSRTALEMESELKTAKEECATLKGKVKDLRQSLSDSCQELFQLRMQAKNDPKPPTVTVPSLRIRGPLGNAKQYPSERIHKTFGTRTASGRFDVVHERGPLGRASPLTADFIPSSQTLNCDISKIRDIAAAAELLNIRNSTSGTIQASSSRPIFTDSTGVTSALMCSAIAEDAVEPLVKPLEVTVSELTSSDSDSLTPVTMSRSSQVVADLDEFVGAMSVSLLLVPVEDVVVTPVKPTEISTVEPPRFSANTHEEKPAEPNPLGTYSAESDVDTVPASPPAGFDLQSASQLVIVAEAEVHVAAVAQLEAPSSEVAAGTNVHLARSTLADETSPYLDVTDAGSNPAHTELAQTESDARTIQRCLDHLERRGLVPPLRLLPSPPAAVLVRRELPRRALLALLEPPQSKYWMRQRRPTPPDAAVSPPLPAFGKSVEQPRMPGVLDAAWFRARLAQPLAVESVTRS